MISAVKKKGDRQRAGFTLLEMVVVLSISMMIVGGALATLYFSRDEARLTEGVQSIEILAKRARAVATLQQRPYALEFSEGMVSLMPFAEALMEVNDREMMIEDREELGEDGPSYGIPVVRDSWTGEIDMLLFVKRWSTSEWMPITRNNRQIWRFDPNGICEPLGVRVEIEDEGSWMAVLFHPLTASVADTESEIR